jgi:hypothetical protein
MAVALIANIVLSALVFTAVITLLSRAVRAPRRVRRVRVRRGAPAGRGQTAWTSTPAASRIRTPAIGGSDR